MAFRFILILFSVLSFVSANELSQQDPISGIVNTQTRDSLGRLTCEKWSNGIEVNYAYDESDLVTSIDIKNVGQIRYRYVDGIIRAVERWKENQLLYTHEYEDDGEALICNLGNVTRTKEANCHITTSPYSEEVCIYDRNDNLIESTIGDQTTSYSYDAQSRLLLDTAYDEMDLPLGTSVNDKGQLLSTGDIQCEYDFNGNIIKKETPTTTYHYTYDSFGRLSKARNGKHVVKMEYDTSNRRVGKKVFYSSKLIKDQSFIYFGTNEIGSYDRMTEKYELRIPGKSFHKDMVLPIALELNGRTFAPILDARGNIVKLIDGETKKVASSYDISPFGDSIEVTSSKKLFNPWVYATKRFDPEVNLYYFGSRYYDPQVRRWISPDPQGWLDSPNLYTYCKNNPLKYADPNGEWAIIIPIVGGGAKAIVMAAITATALATGSKYAADKINKSREQKQREEWARQDEENERKKREEGERKRKGGHDKFPQRKLPRDSKGNPIPDTDAPHSQMGIRDGRNGRYAQAREFDGKGNPVRDIDFTDHGRPHNHPNPHQHEYSKNPTGGTPSRSKNPKPLN